MHFALVCRPGAEVYDSPENAGYDFDRISRLLEARRDGGDSFAVVDTTEMSDAERWDAYVEGAVSAAGNRYRVARVFGSNRHPGEDFGWRVPALLVFARRGDTYPSDVYPHESRNEGVTTIAGFLTSGS